jgi:hypothetical protein
MGHTRQASRRALKQRHTVVNTVTSESKQLHTDNVNAPTA